MLSASVPSTSNPKTDFRRSKYKWQDKTIVSRKDIAALFSSTAFDMLVRISIICSGVNNIVLRTPLLFLHTRLLQQQ